MTPRDKKFLWAGINMGFACSAGIVGELHGLSREQAARAVEELSQDSKFIDLITSMAIDDIASGGADPRAYTKAMRDLAKRVVAQRDARKARR